MTSTIIPGLLELKKYESINVVDVGSARASFMVELTKIVNKSKIYSIGIDPIDRGFSDCYTKFYTACVDDVNVPLKKNFFKNNKSNELSLKILIIIKRHLLKYISKIYFHFKLLQRKIAI